MKTIQNTLVIFIAFTFCSASCEKPDSEPEFTQGFSCKIDGEEWIAKTPASIGGAVPLIVDLTENNSSFLFSATKKDNDLNIFQRIKISVKNISSEGEYQMRTYDGNEDPRVGFADIENLGTCNAFYHDSLDPGTLKICVFDNEKRQISGTFEMNLIAYKCNDEVMNITDGKFSFRY